MNDPQPSRWRKTRRCASSACVEVDDTGADDVHVRDAAATVVTVGRADWGRFVTALRNDTI